MPLIRRLPKRGFTNIFKKEYAIINIKSLERFEPGQEITPETPDLSVGSSVPDTMA